MHVAKDNRWPNTAFSHRRLLLRSETQVFTAKGLEAVVNWPQFNHIRQAIATLGTTLVSPSPFFSFSLGFDSPTALYAHQFIVGRGTSARFVLALRQALLDEVKE